MKTRLEIFKELCDYVRTSNAQSPSEPKITETDEYISYCLLINDFNRDDLALLKPYIKENGYKQQLVYNKPNWSSNYVVSEAYDRYMTVLYNKEKNKISVNLFDVGYKWAHSKKRYYPLKRKTHIVTLSNTLYIIKQKNRNFAGGVRVYRGEGVDNNIIKILCNLPWLPSNLYDVTYRGLVNTNSPIEAIEKQYGVKIPKIIQNTFLRQEMVTMCRLFDEKDFNKICQILNNVKESEKSVTTVATLDDVMVKIWIPGSGQATYWNDLSLVRDYIVECYRLKIKPSMKMKSRARLETEHRRTTALLMAQGIPEIKPFDCYKDLLAELPYKHEFITKKKRLIQESVEQSHCVASYAHKINSGACGIYSILYDNKKWTLELNKSNKGFMIAQCKGLRNQSAPIELIEVISKLPGLHEYNPEAALIQGQLGNYNF